MYKLNMHILNLCSIFYPIFKTRLASAKKSARLVPMRERQNTAMSTELSRSGTCTDRMRFILFYCNTPRGKVHLKVSLIILLEQKTYKAHTHISHVTDCNKFTGSCQVKAVHFVLHIARYFTVTATKVCNHQRGRSENKR